MILLSKSRRRVRAISSTDCTTLSAAPLEPLLFRSEVHGVAAVSSAHASWMTAMSACSESPWMITLGCPTYRANSARQRLANGSLFSFFSRGMATICLYTVSMATKTVTIGASSSVFRKQKSHWMTGVPGCFCDRDTCLFSFPRARTQMLLNVWVNDVSARNWLAHRVPELRSQLVVPLLLVPSIHPPSPRQ